MFSNFKIINCSFFFTFLLFLNNLSIFANPIIPDGSTNTNIISTYPHIVNIATPNANGTSINNYSQFNVPSSGAVLNNSPNYIFTQVAGGIAGNPNLMGSSAHTIINQVTSNNPSFLEGKLEIAGSKANLIIANPNGIKINGGQFLNTGTTSLTTGRIYVNSLIDKDQINFITNSGEIEIGSAGLSGFMDNLNLISKTLKIKGAINNSNPRLSNGVQIITGNSNLITNAKNTSFFSSFRPYFENLPTIGTGANNTEIIVDLDQIGSITASKISILITDKGAGVNFDAGSINAKSDFEISTDGKLAIKDSIMNIRGDTKLIAGNLISENLQLNGDQSISFNSDDMNLINNSIFTETDLKLNGNSIKASGDTSLKAKGNFNIGGNNIEFIDTEINIGRKSEVIASNLTIKNPFSIWQSEDLDLILTGNLNNISAGLSAINSVTLEAQNLNQSQNAYLMSSAGIMDLSISNAINNSNSSIRSFSDLTIESGILNNKNKSEILSNNGSISITENTDLFNDNSLIQSNKDIKIINNNIWNSNNGIIFSKDGNLSLKATNGIYNYGSRILSNHSAQIEADIIKNYTSQSPSIKDYSERKGSYFLWKRKTIKTWSEIFPELDTEIPIIFANDDLTLKANKKLENIGGQIIANNGSINIETKDLLNKALRVGEVYYEETCRFLCSSKGYANIAIKGGQISAGNELNIKASNSINNMGGSLLAINDLTLTSPNIINSAYPIYRFKKRYRGLKFWETSGWRIYALDFGGDMSSINGKLKFYTNMPFQNYAGLLSADDGIEAPNGINEMSKRRTTYKRIRGIGLFESFFRSIKI